MTPQEAKTELHAAMTLADPVGTSLLPILKRFEHITDPLTYNQIAMALFDAYRQGMKASTEDLMTAGKAVRG